MKDISTVPGVDTATTNKPFGVPLDDSTPGDGLGMAIREDHYSDLYYSKIAVMNDVGLTPDNSEEGVTTSQFRDAIIEMSIKYGQPIGTEIDWHPNLGGLTPSLTALYSKYYVPSDGSLISISDSVYNGYRAPNTNGSNVVLTGVTWASGVATIPATDVTALSIGDDVTCTGIADNSYIANIVGTTVTLTDTAISGTLDTTFTNDGLFVRGGSASGVGQKDQIQGHHHRVRLNISAVAFGSVAIAGSSATGTSLEAETPLARTIATDGTNGTPRTGTETHPSNNTRKKLFKIL